VRTSPSLDTRVERAARSSDEGEGFGLGERAEGELEIEGA